MFGRRNADSIQDAVARPASIRRLWLRRPADYDEVADLLPRLPRIREVSFGWQSWTTLPSELCDLRSLRSLTVLNTPIRTFPTELSSCPKLRELVLRGTDITSIPTSIGQFVHLRKLDLVNNRISEVPVEIFRLTKLKEIRLKPWWQGPVASEKE